MADNKLAEGSDWDLGRLKIELEEILALDLQGELGFDVDLTSFGTPEIDVILDGSGAGAGEEAQESVELPASDAVPVSRLGDLWQLGLRLLCGNALDADASLRLMAGELARLIFTDPPYNVPIAGHVRVAPERARQAQGATATASSRQA